VGYLESLSSVDVPRDTETHRGVADGKTLVTTLTQAPGEVLTSRAWSSPNVLSVKARGRTAWPRR